MFVSGGSRNTAASTRAPEELTLLNPKTIVEEVEVEVSDNVGLDQRRDGGLEIALAMTIDCLKVKNIPMSRFPTNPKSESCSVFG